MTHQPVRNWLDTHLVPCSHGLEREELGIVANLPMDIPREENDNGCQQGWFSIT
jgi:hypothetical protein